MAFGECDGSRVFLQVRTFQVEVKDGAHAFVRLHLPPGLREYEEMVFPLVLHVCGETLGQQVSGEDRHVDDGRWLCDRCAAPGSQLVSELWSVDWGTYLASSHNFIVVQVDRCDETLGQQVSGEDRHVGDGRWLCDRCAAPGSQLVSERWSVDWGTYLASSRNFIVAQVDRCGETLGQQVSGEDRRVGDGRWLCDRCAAPGSQLVSERWSVDWGTYLASSRNFIVAQVDGRGSGFQGERMVQQLHHRLGSIEVEDQIAVIKYLRDNLNFVDKEKVAVWGWGHGGFTAAMILAEDDDVFKCGISVAPITSWALYDSVYTERYMGSPNVTDNYRGYEEADLTRRAAELRDKLYLLVHGTADERVHYQHSMALVRAMAEEGVLFRHLTYPDEGHSFSGAQRHLHKAMEAFLDDCFGPINFDEWEVGTSFFSFKQ
ncbi:hypothetical protein PR048_007580 [Dryococelus australis]|uniref:Peptidase S9 prolyl oligopeptidase catalytic domain-containing protein n=1 Tax=Dryococelus australis TaxID=614101 RepID=A0ABQ9HUM6_9NEOP|nr:hypothetical protein PR048_007580 [Dryococelus australis]